MNESETRAELIDPALREAGWGVVAGSRVRREFPITKGRLEGYAGKRGSTLSADYVLTYRNRNLAVIEAKKRNLYYTEGLTQAKEYAQRLNIRYTYATNGDRIYQVDMEESVEGDVRTYPTPEALWEMTFPAEDTMLDKLFAVPFETRGGTWQPRYYQENAITKTLEAIANDQQRILLTLATGTGKTAIAFQIAWKLFHAKWNLKSNTDGDFSRSPRILFLADRNILADQAFNAFGAFEEDALVRIDPSEIRKKGSVPKNGNIFFTIFQTFMSGDGETGYFGEYPPDFFDFIIIDECHRGGANDESSWRAILDYFSPAFQLGLTATPKRDVNTDTYSYFGKPVYEYSLKEGINDGFLTPFKVKEIATTGDKYVYTEDDEVLEGEVEEGREYTKEDQNKIIEIMEIERYKVRLFLDMMNQDEKTLVFCETQVHAAAIRDLINQESKSKNPNYCQRVTANDGARGEQQLKYFQDNEKSIPTILTTSRKLSTGVDAPEIKHIVLLRLIKSMVEFKQIVGRGTRLYDNKDYFTIYDFVEAYKHFSDSEWDGELPDPEPIEPKELCKKCGERPCVCEKEGEDEPCDICGNRPCVCDKGPKGMIRIRLSPTKAIELDSMVKTSFYAPDGKPMSAGEFVRKLFDDLPKFFESEAELRRIWSLPDTRKRLLEELSEHGYSQVQLEELKKLVKAENSDIFDVLSYVAYHRDIIPRLTRATKAELRLMGYDKAKQAFLNFVLKQYVKEGVKELDDTRLKGLLEVKYGGTHEAKIAMGDVAGIREAFVGFQKYLYEDRVVGAEMEEEYLMVAEPEQGYGNL